MKIKTKCECEKEKLCVMDHVLFEQENSIIYGFVWGMEGQKRIQVGYHRKGRFDKAWIEREFVTKL